MRVGFFALPALLLSLAILIYPGMPMDGGSQVRGRGVNRSSSYGMEIDFAFYECKKLKRVAGLDRFRDSCRLWNGDKSKSTYFAVFVNNKLLPVQSIYFGEDRPKAIVIYLVGGPAGKPIRLGRELLTFLRQVFPESLVIVPSYTGTIDRVPLQMARAIPLAQLEIAALVRKAGQTFPDAKIFIVGESFGAYLTERLDSKIAGMVYLSPPSSSASAILRRGELAAGPRRRTVDRTNVMLIDDHGKELGRRMANRAAMMNVMLSDASAANFRLSRKLSTKSCAVAVFGDGDHLTRPQDDVFSQDLRDQVVVLPALGHDLTTSTDALSVQAATAVKSYLDANCR